MSDLNPSRATSTARAARHQQRSPRHARPATTSPLWSAARAAHQQRREDATRERTLPLLIPTWLLDQDEHRG
jgi:hypothetical protein